MVPTPRLIAAMGLEAEDLISFFVTFSRFEYALASAGFVRDQRGTAEADWDSLMNFLDGLEPAAIAPVLAAGSDLAADPPKRMVLLDDGSIDFTAVRRNQDSHIRFLVKAVKRGRNNLFHGGKFRRIAPQRNAFVVRNSLRVLQALLEMPALGAIQDAYHDLPR